ncbi:inositol-3-phosphate synthase [Agromyces mangrovi Wang et al. 2018]|uniref:inositol-3-phosphate synthase n=1 Tax=Agromyces mangrovi TaxID=1858653 RepID=UPI0025733D4B|nr:inositol-3-phosphate synthase [Agromyces mangrovi]BDZ65233.1 myo-inositol-1-phosphate synthase [Agromyces mangrovi]
MGRVGMWCIGARGSVATTAAIGVHAIGRGLAGPVGCVTAGPAFAEAPLAEIGDIVVGGHDVASVPLLDRARQLAASGMVPTHLVEAVAEDLASDERELRPGYVAGLGESQGAALDRLTDDIRSFRERNRLDHVVVVDVSSTEPLPADDPAHHDERVLAERLADPSSAALPASSLAALAAIESGSAFAGFTPSAGIGLPVVRARAEHRGTCFAGCDGKTGETLLRTVLGPMFVDRGMRVLSWAGANLLGGGDGATLADADAVRSKLASKTRGLRSIVGDGVVAPLHIDNVPDLGDVKTAWDHVHAEGFLNSRITLQTTWSAYDSMLAAPLVIDLVRLLALAEAAGRAGAISELGYFFKDPIDSDEHAFHAQSAALHRFATAAANGVRATEAIAGVER